MYFAFTGVILFSQKKEASVYSYDFFVNGNYNDSDLKVLNNESLFSIYYSQIKEDANSEISDDDMHSSTVIRIPAPDEFFYTNNTTGLLYSNERFLNKTFVVKDSIPVLNWVLMDEFKEVLGHRCQKATVNFRGRDYVAYFNPDIPENFGPWKFHGLPGLIFKITSLDNYVAISLRDIDIAEVVDLNNFKDKKPIDYLDYKILVQNKYKSIVDYTNSKNDTGKSKGFFMYDSIEHYLFKEINEVTRRKIREASSL